MPINRIIHIPSFYPGMMSCLGWYLLHLAMSSTPASDSTKSLLAYWTGSERTSNKEKIVLEALCEKLLSVFGLDDTHEGEHRRYHLNRDIVRGYAAWSRIPGNDFDSPYANMPTDQAVWSARLQLNVDDHESTGQRTIELPFTHVSRIAGGGSTVMTAETAVLLLRQLWPTTTMGAIKRPLIGPRFQSAEFPECKILSALGSLDVNCENVDLKMLYMHENGFTLSTKESQTLLSRDSWTQDIKPFVEPPCLDGESERGGLEHRVKQYVAHVWSINSFEKPWILSVPMIATILSLMTNPSKSVQDWQRITTADRDLSWCLNSLHSFCRLTHPADGERDLSFSLGTYSDCWMYLSCTITCFKIVGRVTHDTNNGENKPSGLRCDRTEFDVPGIGHFRECRLLLTARIATGYESYKLESEPVDPYAVNVILTDLGHQPLSVSESDWKDRKLSFNGPVGGIALFQTKIWDHLDFWSYMWDRCLNKIAQSVEMKVDDLTDDERLISLRSAEQLLCDFRKLIALAPRSIRRMKERWAGTYSGKHSNNQGRLRAEPDQVLAKENWESISHRATQLEDVLVSRCRNIQADVKRLQDAISAALFYALIL